MTITVPTRVGVFIAAAAAALALGGAYVAGDAHASGATTVTALPGASSADKSQGVTVAGLGRVTGTPDVLNVRIGVEVRRGDVDAALQGANQTITHIRDAFRKSGVADRDLQTSGLAISPTYTNKGSINGYSVSESFNAKLRNLSHAGKTISAAAKAGGNSVRIDSIYFDLEHDTALVKSARTAAFAEAKAKAQQYADASGRNLGAVTSISEQVSQPPNVYADQLRSSIDVGKAASFAAVPIEAGTQDVTVTVTVVWAFR
jgi:uncharacterized protein YggE